MRAPLKKVIMAKYVRLLEIMGYAIAAIMLTLWIIFFFIHVDENCFGSGPVKPAMLDIINPERAVLDEAKIPDGQWVKKDQVLFKLNLDKKAVAARQAQTDLASLGNQVLTLADSGPERADLEQTVATMLTKVGGLATGREEKSVAAPEDGLLDYTISTTSTAAHPVVEGTLAQVISSKLMWAELELGQLNRDRVAVGQTVKINIRLNPEKKDKTSLVGKVVKIPAPGKAIVEAPVTVGVLGERLVQQIANPNQADKPLMAEAKVVVGNIPFVRLLFPKSTPPAAADPKEKKENFIKRTWHKVFPAKQAAA